MITKISQCRRERKKEIKKQRKLEINIKYLERKKDGDTRYVFRKRERERRLKFRIKRGTTDYTWRDGGEGTHTHTHTHTPTHTHKQREGEGEREWVCVLSNSHTF